MTSAHQTVASVAAAKTWDKRVSEIRLIPEKHGIGEHAGIFAAIARELYVPHLAPEFAFVADAPFYDADHFKTVYTAAEVATEGFTNVNVESLATLLEANPATLLVFRTMTGLLGKELAPTTKLVVEQMDTEDLMPVSKSTVDNAEKRNGRLTASQARVLAHTIDQLMRRELFADAPAGWHSKQDKIDSRDGWDSVRDLATNGVPYQWFLHQRHYGGSFSQVTNATTSMRGDLLEDDVETLFRTNGVPYIRTGSHNQGDIAAQFGVTVTPAPDFVVFDKTGALRAILECKSAEDGGTARDKAGRFGNLKAEGARLGGVPVVAVLGGIGWARLNDTLGPVVQHTDGRVFTVETLDEMLTVQPFPQLIGLVTPE